MSNYCDKGHWEAGMKIPCKQCEIDRLKAELKEISKALDDPRTDLTLTMVEVIEDMKKALRSAPSKPVAWFNRLESDNYLCLSQQEHPGWMPLYTHPAQSDKDAALKTAKTAIEFAVTGICMCFSGCDKCHPDPAPPTLEEALAAIDAAMGEEK